MDFMSILGRCLLLPFPVAMFVGCLFPGIDDRFTGMFMSFIVGCLSGTVAKLAMRQPFVLFKGLTFQKLCLPGAFRPGDHHNKMLRPGLCVVHASPQYL